MKKALIMGITGQDGSYMADYLLGKGYEVHGTLRRSSSFNTKRLDHLHNPDEDIHEITLHYADLADSSSINILLNGLKVDEVYNFAAQSHVGVSFKIPEYTCDIDAMGTLRLLEAIRNCDHEIRMYQAGSSEMFGRISERKQREDTPFNPQSPYGCSKLFSYHICKNYRDAYGLFVSNGILFNHESPRRGENFVTRKVCIGIVDILKGKKGNITLGNLDAKRDWGYAPDFVDSIWKILQYKKPEDFVIATGETHMVREMVEIAFSFVDIKIEWKGRGFKEVGINTEDGSILVRVDPIYYRPNEVDFLLGDYSKAKNLLGWEPTVKFNELIKIMMRAELEKSKIQVKF